MEARDSSDWERVVLRLDELMFLGKSVKLVGKSVKFILMNFMYLLI